MQVEGSERVTIFLSILVFILEQFFLVHGKLSNKAEQMTRELIPFLDSVVEVFMSYSQWNRGTI